MNCTINDCILTIFTDEKIDTQNADAVGSEIASLCEANPHTRLVLDMGGTKYISSAGLRQILKCKKQEKAFSIVNVSADVYDVFDMTGFTQMIDIEKAYREFDVTGCEVIGEGSNGVVYRIDGDTIIKVYRNPDVLDDIKKERELAQKALILGVNTAISYDVVKVGDRYGSMFELLGADCLTTWIRKDPANIDKYIKVFTDLLKEIHSIDCAGEGLPDGKAVVMNYVDYLYGKLDEPVYDKLNRMVTGIPECDNMLHGDYHTNNVHYDGSEPILIDMDTLGTGNPIIEIASIYNAYVGFGAYDFSAVEKFMKLDSDTCAYIWKKFLSLYFNTDDADFLKTIENKAKVLAYTRLLRRTIKRDSENTALISFYKKMLIDSVSAVDDLII